MSNTTKGPFMQAMEKYTKSIKTFISAQGFGHYSKPNDGIPKSDLEQSVQNSLGKADSALQSFTESDPTVPSWAKASTKPSYTQDEVGDGTTYKRVSATEKTTWNNKGTYSKPSGGIPKTDLASAVQTSLGKADSALQSETDPTVPAWAKAASKPSYTASEVGLGNVGNFKAVSTVASQGLSSTEQANARANIGAGTSSFSGSYNDLSNKPIIPTKVSQLTNDAGYTTNTGTVTGVKVGASSYSPSSGIVSLPAYPTTLPASDVYSWAKASSKPSYTSSEVGAVPTTHPFFSAPINHNMIYRGQNLGATLTDAQHTALSSGNFTDLYLGDYWTKTVTIPAGTYTGGDGEEVTVPAQTNITLKAVIADFDTFYAGYASSYAGINTHHAAVIVTGFGNVVWNKTNSAAGGYVASLIHKWLVGSALPEIETWFGSAKVLSHQKLLTNAITGDAASEWAWSSQKISLLSENQMYGSKVWGNSKAANGGYEPGEAFKHLNVFNHIDANLLFGNKNIWLRDIASAEWAAILSNRGYALYHVASYSRLAPAALILLS